MTVSMPTLTYADGLARARYVFRHVAMRAHKLAGDEQGFVLDLAITWDDRLADLVASAEPMTEDEIIVFDDLSDSASDPDLAISALVEWVDAYPSAVLDLFAGKAVDIGSEFTDEDEPGPEPETAAANKQSSLALAA